MLADPNNSPRGCAVEPTTGNLAVADNQDNITIYPDAGGTPTYYSTAGLVEKPSSTPTTPLGTPIFSARHGNLVGYRWVLPQS
jgi:DNA-binding beta-propeller fold protein YncE